MVAILKAQREQGNRTPLQKSKKSYTLATIYDIKQLWQKFACACPAFTYSVTVRYAEQLH